MESRIRARRRREILAAYLLLAPAALLVFGVLAFPFGWEVWVSLTDSFVQRTSTAFIGLANYLQLLRTPLFWQALLNTLFFVVVGVPVSVGASLVAALLLHSPLARFKGFYRTALFVPVVTTLAAVAVGGAEVARGRTGWRRSVTAEWVLWERCWCGGRGISSGGAGRV